MANGGKLWRTLHGCLILCERCPDLWQEAHGLGIVWQVPCKTKFFRWLVVASRRWNKWLQWNLGEDYTWRWQCSLMVVGPRYCDY